MEKSDIGQIQARLLAIEERKDVNANPYLLLKTEKDNLYCFPSQISVERWHELQVGKEYLFTAQESRLGTWNLRKFEEVEVNEIFI